MSSDNQTVVPWRAKSEANPTPLSVGPEAFGYAGRVIRCKARLTQSELALLSQLSRQQVGEIERGRTNPSFTTIVAIAEALALELPMLFMEVARLHAGGVPR